MKKAVKIFIFLLGNFLVVYGQNSFHGTFLMSFISPSAVNDNPMLWNIESTAVGGKMALEIQDELISKGVSKRVIFNPADSTWTMLLSLNNIKQGTRVHRAAMFREAEANKFSSVINTNEKRFVNGFKCRKTIIESKNYIAELWITDKLKFNLCHIYKLLAHCGMVNDNLRKGDWYLWHAVKGMILEVNSKNKDTGELYNMKISNIVPGFFDEKYFDINGFKISEIPEGQNCGVPMEGK